MYANNDFSTKINLLKYLILTKYNSSLEMCAINKWYVKDHYKHTIKKKKRLTIFTSKYYIMIGYMMQVTKIKYLQIIRHDN